MYVLTFIITGILMTNININICLTLLCIVFEAKHMIKICIYVCVYLYINAYTINDKTSKQNNCDLLGRAESNTCTCAQKFTYYSFPRFSKLFVYYFYISSWTQLRSY